MTTQWQPDGPLDTPYRRARQEWDARMGSALVHAKNWRLATFGSMAAVLVMAGGMIYLGSLPKAVPHIIEVDRLGAAVYHGPVGQADYVPSDAVVSYHLRRFIADTREISSDAAVLKQNWLDAYTLLTPRGRQHALGVPAEARERSVPARAGRARHRGVSLHGPRRRRHLAGRLARIVLGQERGAHRRAPSRGAPCCARSF